MKRTLMKEDRIISLIAFLICIFAAVKYGEHRERGTIYETFDTILVHDTIEKPICVDSQVIRTKYISVPYTLYKRDTINNTDTIIDSVRVALPITRKVYEDSTYKAVISGYEPLLESMIVKSRVITNTRLQYVKKAPKWGIGVQAGYGYNTKELTPYIGIGVNYNIFTW